MVFMTLQLPERQPGITIDDMSSWFVANNQSQASIRTGSGTIHREGVRLRRDQGVRLDVEDAHDAVVGGERSIWRCARTVLEELHVVCDGLLICGQDASGLAGEGLVKPVHRILSVEPPGDRNTVSCCHGGESNGRRQVIILTVDELDDLPRRTGVWVGEIDPVVSNPGDAVLVDGADKIAKLEVSKARSEPCLDSSEAEESLGIRQGLSKLDTVSMSSVLKE
jgi:hypothetical protein